MHTLSFVNFGQNYHLNQFLLVAWQGHLVAMSQGNTHPRGTLIVGCRRGLALWRVACALKTARMPGFDPRCGNFFYSAFLKINLKNHRNTPISAHRCKFFYPSHVLAFISGNCCKGTHDNNIFSLLGGFLFVFSFNLFCLFVHHVTLSGKTKNKIKPTCGGQNRIRPCHRGFGSGLTLTGQMPEHQVHSFCSLDPCIKTKREVSGVQDHAGGKLLVEKKKHQSILKIVCMFSTIVYHFNGILRFSWHIQVVEIRN